MPDSFQTYQQLEGQITAILKTVTRTETKLQLMCDSNRERQTAVDKRLDIHEGRLDTHEGRLDTYASWGKAVGILGSVIILILAFLNILAAVGVKL